MVEQVQEQLKNEELQKQDLKEMFSNVQQEIAKLLTMDLFPRYEILFKF